MWFSCHKCRNISLEINGMEFRGSNGELEGLWLPDNVNLNAVKVGTGGDSLAVARAKSDGGEVTVAFSKGPAFATLMKNLWPQDGEPVRDWDGRIENTKTGWTVLMGGGFLKTRPVSGNRVTWHFEAIG